MLVECNVTQSRSACMYMSASPFFFMIYGVVIVFTWFFAGMLADIRFGRYKTVVNSLFIVLIAVIFN